MLTNLTKNVGVFTYYRASTHCIISFFLVFGVGDLFPLSLLGRTERERPKPASQRWWEGGGGIGRGAICCCAESRRRRQLSHPAHTHTLMASLPTRREKKKHIPTWITRVGRWTKFSNYLSLAKWLYLVRSIMWTLLPGKSPNFIDASFCWVKKQKPHELQRQNSPSF